MVTYWFYNEYDDINSLLDYTSSLRLPDSNKIKFLFLISDGNLFRHIGNWIPQKYTLQIQRETRNLRVYKLLKEIRRRDGTIEEISGIFNIFRVANSNLYVIITIEKNYFAKDILLKYFNHNFFRISKLHFTSKQMENMLDYLKENLDLDKIITDRLLSRSRLDEKETPIGKTPKLRVSNIKWTDESYKLSFRDALEKNYRVDNISFYAVKEDKVFFNASLSRSGFFQCSPTNITSFYQTLIRIIRTIARNQTNVFSKRSRLENKGEVRPITIKYEDRIFVDREQNIRFVNIISDYPQSSMSVYHKNPYMHLSLIDYKDGSSYDIWILSENEITIVPQLRCTFNSISRLSEFILEKFQEGELLENS